MSERDITDGILDDAMRAMQKRLDKRPYKPERYELWYETDGLFLHPSVDKAHKAVQWWLNDILHGCEERVRWVTLYGAPGCGKTHLLQNAIKVLRKHKDFRAQYYHWRKFKESQLQDYALRCEYLAIDDLFCDYMASEKAEDYNRALLLDIMEQRKGRWTLFATNYAPTEMPDQRLESRLFRWGNEVVDMSKAGDYSRIKGNGKAD